MTFPTLLTGALIAQGIYAGIVLFAGAKNRRANRLLGLLVLLSSFWLIDTFLRVSGGYGTNPDLYFMPIFYSFGFGPLIYLYTRAITDKAYAFQRRDVYHFVPVLIQGLFYAVLFFSTYSFKRWYWLEVHKPVTYDLEFNLTLISLSVYSFLSITTVARYQNWIKDQFSEISKIHLNWLKTLQYLLVVICVFWLLEAVLREVFLVYAQQPVSALSLSLCMLLLATGGLLQADVFPYGIESPSDVPDDLAKVEIEPELLNRIKAKMRAHRYYLDPELTLKTFARRLDLPPRRVSHHLNQGLNTTFIDFVNTYRIELVKERIFHEDYDHLTLHGIALESGFNSKSTFNRVFKNHVGLTPSAYKKRGQNTD